MITAEVYSRNPMAAWTEFEDKTFVISAEDSTLHELNATGAFIWQQMESKLTKKELAERVASEFDVTPEQVLADVDDFISALVNKNLVRKETGE